MASPVKQHIRQLALARTLYYYGGFVVPASFVCFHDLDNMYNKMLQSNDMFIAEDVSHNITSSLVDFFPSTNFMGCKKNSKVMKEFYQYLEQLNSSDFTSNSDFDGTVNRWLFQKCEQGKIHKVGGNVIGIQNKEGKPILLDDLMSDKYIDLAPNCVGIYIPADQVLRRTKYEWFARMSFQQLLTCDAIICKHILLCNKIK